MISGPTGWRNGPILRALDGSHARGEIRRLEYVEEATLRALYREADALLLPSLDEGFGLPAVEAAALGTPAFVSDRGALTEVAPTRAHVLPLEIDAWVTALASPPQLDEDEQRRHAAGFSWAAAAIQLNRLFCELSE